MADSTDKLPNLDQIKLRGYTLNLNRYLQANYDDISHAAAELPSIMEWINECLHDFRETKGTYEAELEELEAKAYFDLVGGGPGGFAENYDGKPTEAALKHAVALDPEVKKKKREFTVALGWCQRLMDMQNSFRAKLELTRSSESTRRTVFDNDKQ